MEWVYLLACDALSTTQATFAFAVFERAFKDFAERAVHRTMIPACCFIDARVAVGAAPCRQCSGGLEQGGARDAKL